MSLSDLSIRNPVFAWMLMAFLVVFGAVGFSRLGVSELPDVDFPTVSVRLGLEGASPEIMETDVVDPVEDVLMSVEGVREITASCRQGSASVSIEFGLDRDIDAAVQDVQAKLASAARNLPRDLDPPQISKQNPEDQPILWLALSGHLPLTTLVEVARDQVKDRFQTVPGVGEVTLSGDAERALRLWLKLDAMEARGLAVADVLAALPREHVEVPAGRIETGLREMNVRTSGEAPTVAEFRQLVVAWRNGAPVRLEDVAVIEDGLTDVRRVARANGVPSVGFGIRKQRGANAVAVGRAVKARLAEVREQLPAGMDLAVNFDGTRFVEEAIGEIKFTLVLSVLCTGLVCWIFLGSWSSTFNILLSIPTSIVGSFLVIYFLGFTLNTFTLLGLSLAVGIVVDDAIMVLENIVRHREQGCSQTAAASAGARQITFAAIAATLAIIAIFLPIAFLEGVIGKFLYQFGVTISIAVALSLLEALTLTPMRCAQFLAVGERATPLGRGLERGFRALAVGYGRLLGPVLRWRWVVLLLATGGFVATLAVGGFAGPLKIGPGLRQEMVPPQDQGRFMVRIQTAAGSALDYTDARMREAERLVRERPEVERIFAIIGGFGGGEVDTGMVMVSLKPPAERGVVAPATQPLTQQELQGVLRGRLSGIPGLRAFISDSSARGLTGRGSEAPIQFVVTGPDWPTLAASSEALMEAMTETGLLTDVKSNYVIGMPEVRIVPDRQRAADLGVSMAEIGTTVNALIGGVRAGKFKSGAHRYDVRVRLLADARRRPEDVARLFVRGREGGLVRLADVVRVLEQPTVQSITRRNRARAITVTANLAPRVSQPVAMARVQALADARLAPDTRIEFTGSSQMFQQGGWSLLFALGFGVIVAYMVLASQFNSFVHPFLVLLAMPFSLSGAILAMRWFDISVNLYSMIGVVLLMGIVKKNSILLVEFTNHVRARGVPVTEALREACPIRLRPILMTSVSTLAAALPPALALGPGAESRVSMAIVVIGGVTLSTVLTLFVVPCAYAILPGRVRRLAAPEPDPALAPADLAPAAVAG